MPASKVEPVPISGSGWNAVVSTIGSMVRARACTPNAPGMRLKWNTYPTWSKDRSAGQLAWLRESSDLSDSMRAIPAAFQNSAVASSATPTKAPPMAAARAPRSEEHTSELQSPCNLVCRLLLEKKNKSRYTHVDLNISRGI